jgi:hypothetical protein
MELLILVDLLQKVGLLGHGVMELLAQAVLLTHILVSALATEFQ